MAQAMQARNARSREEELTVERTVEDNRAPRAPDSSDDEDVPLAVLAVQAAASKRRIGSERCDFASKKRGTKAAKAASSNQDPGGETEVVDSSDAEDSSDEEGTLPHPTPPHPIPPPP
jgi:hypothetical protein